jgi:phospholipid/cholesterol/gamma-HCH transport system permease protein
MAPVAILSTLTGWPGRRLIQSMLYIIDLVTFSFVALRAWFGNNRLFRRQSYRTLVQQVIFTGIDALPTISLLGLVTGFLFTFRLIEVVSELGAPGEIVGLLVSIICLGIGPFIAAIILISRTGSAIVVDIGNMKLHGEIDGLEMLGIDINDLLIAPRIIGCALSQLVITIYFTTIALVTGILLAGSIINSDLFKLLITMSSAFTPAVMAVFVTKNLLFGYVIATIACYHGLSVSGSPTEVPQRTTRAIVDCLIVVFAIDGLLALMLLR